MTKHKRIALKQSDNIFKDILSPLSERGDSGYVYFYRIVGCDDELKYRAEIVCLDEKLKALGNYIRFDKAIHITTDSSLIDQTRKLFDQVPLKDFSNGALLNLLETRGYFSLTPNNQFTVQIKTAFGVMLELYLIKQPTINLSMLVNFLTKILLWLADYGKQICKESIHNPKLVYWGSPKEHEIYFLILMSLIGCDVLVLNTSFIDNFDKVDKQNEFSFLTKKANDIPIGAFPANPSEGKKCTGIEPPKSEKVEENLSNSQGKLALNDHIIVVKLKKNENVFAEILVPLSKRSGYVGKPYPIIPAYFVRYIGAPATVDDWEAEYYNSLYNLDKALQMSGAYIKFIYGIPTPYAAESAAIPHKLIDYPYKDRLEILEQILQSNILFQTHDELLDNTIRRAFVDIATLFAERNSNINLSILLNFTLKLVTWLNRYLPELFSSKNKGFDYERNPKILFYGNIKPHEIYLLCAFHKIGCDVLFVHSQEDGDKPFQSFDLHQQVTKLIKHTHTLPLASFPQVEQVIRKSTVAYNASKEIEEVIYSEDVGLFQPWQFESYLTQPITLKTTYDELKILWREQARIRPEFKVQNKKVYVPNLFAKINGVNENINNYWQDIKALSLAANTRLISDVPFSHISYTKQELYQTAYLLNQQGLFDEVKVVESKHYKFGYLKGPLQHFLITKINELILSGMFLGTVDEKFKLKILMTILTMDDYLVKLIEMFDYPQEIPKVIVYDNEKETFSESDAILLAYFNIIGLDIVIFTPTNYKTIEQHIRPSFLDVHQLPLVKFDLAIPALSNITSPATKPGLLSRILKLR
ncbi:MAG TPA: YceG family protein [Candidatus Deferrimicrobium sp.]|nr:YceG family protein [Candidatus Deferrimicrobium sp.]